MNRENIWKIHRHLHSTFEIHIVKSGDSKVLLDDKTLFVKTGDCFITPPGVNHEQYNGRQKSYSEYSINVDLEMLNNEKSDEQLLFNTLSNQKVEIIENGTQLISLFEDSLIESGNKYSGYTSIIQSNLVTILVMLSRELNNNKLSNSYVKKDKSKELFNKIHSYIKANVLSSISVSDVANHVYLSEKQVSRIVQKNIGTNIKSLIDIKRNEKACEIIRNSSMSMKEISEYLNFSSPFVFSKFFRRMNSKTPLYYRRMSEKDNL
jgi:AraC-like DNA-binding protein